MKISFSFGWKVLIVILLLFAIGGRNEAKAENLKDILDGKIPLEQGRCYFKGGKFLAFASGTWMSSKGFMDRIEGCFVFAESMTPISNPVWLVLLDRKGFPKEVIKWENSLAGSPGEFSSVWKPENEGAEPAKGKPKRGDTEI